MPHSQWPTTPQHEELAAPTVASWTVLGGLAGIESQKDVLALAPV